MGYRTVFRITTEPEESRNAVVSRLGRVSDYYVEEDGCAVADMFCDEIKWYDHEEDCLAVSQEFPNVTIRVHGTGEEHGDQWVRFYRNGKVQRHAQGAWCPPTSPNEKGWE